ncbi:MAG: hypothetical protein KGO82_12210 [Bacteroidota bacterium]|nr:hypothetical protein [Bacteroidota bacterium]
MKLEIGPRLSHAIQVITIALGIVLAILMSGCQKEVSAETKCGKVVMVMTFTARVQYDSLHFETVSRNGMKTGDTYCK